MLPIFLVDPHLKTPYTYQYNLSLQHELAKNTVVEVSYVGSSSHGLTSLQDINPFVLGTTDRVLNLGTGDSSCVDEDGNSTSGVSPFNPNSFSIAQCGDNNNPIATCVPGPTIFPSNAQVVANPALATYGTLPRNFLRGPGYINIDMAFSKTTAITQRVKLEFRAEFFNLFNHANFLNPGVINNGVGNNNETSFLAQAIGNNPHSMQFGQITSTYDPRIIQLALRLAF